MSRSGPDVAGKHVHGFLSNPFQSLRQVRGKGLIPRRAGEKGSGVFQIDSYGEQLSVDNLGSGISGTTGTPNVPDVVLTSTYDADGNRTSLSATIGASNTADFVNGYTYNSLNQEAQVTQGGSSGGDAVDQKLVAFTYDADGEVATITRLAGSSNAEIANSTYSYDGSGRLTNLTHTAANGKTYANDTWTYNADNEVTSFANAASFGNANYSDENVTSYSYDSTGELVGAKGPQGQANASNSLTNQYDANGNATTLNGAGTSIGAGNTLLFDGTYYDTYDANGNLIIQANSLTNPTAETAYTYLCLCQLAVADFSVLSFTRSAKLTQPLRSAVVSRSFCYRRSQGTSRCSFAHRSMAA